MGKNCYIVTSAIGTRTAPEKTIERFHQTLHTVDSINARDPNAEIFILDTGLAGLPDWLINRFQKNVDFVNLTDHKKVQEISAEAQRMGSLFSQNFTIKNKTKEETKDFIDHGYLKSVTESWSIQHFFETKDLSDYDKVFKISGRYFLNEDFDLNNFNNKFSFRKQSENIKELGGITSISSVCWCFQAEHFEEFKAKWDNTIVWMLGQWKSGRIRDLESSIWMGFGNTEEERQITYVSKVGVMGIINMKDGHKKAWAQ